jgi:aryl-alcohol dehydrogenase-like predicted oxidoreductase
VFFRTRRVVIALLGCAGVAGYLWIGALLEEIPIGLDKSAFPAGGAIQTAAQLIWPDLLRTLAGVFWLAIALLCIALVVFFAVRASVRRGVLLGLGRGGRGWKRVMDDIFMAPVVETHPEWPDAWKGSRVRAHRRFGRTGWNVSDIVLGTTGIDGEKGEKITRLVIERGVNYIDTAPDYSAAGSEVAVGRAIRGARDRLFIATKFCTPLGHLPTGTPVAHYKGVVEASLGRLGTDYVDLCHVHSCNSVARLLDPNLHEAFDRLKQEGKVRFLGFSSHTPDLFEVAEAAIDSGRFDVMMLAYHHGLWATLNEVIARARREQDMGVVAMKTLKGAKHHGLAGFREHADTYSQAALKWTLSNPDVSCAVISFYELQHVDEYLRASGRSLTAEDVSVLDAYDARIRGTYCAPHCGACLSSCPEGLVIHDVLRHRMYFEDYGRKEEGVRLYAQLERNATVGIPIQARMIGANGMLARA